jgi:hypothetical protein
MKDSAETSRETPRSEARAAWITPTVKDMPRLQDLTLQTGLVMTDDQSPRGFRV